MMPRIRLPYEFAVLFAAILYLWLSQFVMVYAYDTSGGVTVTTPAGCVGLEVYGHPGFWGGRDPGACDI